LEILKFLSGSSKTKLFLTNIALLICRGWGAHLDMMSPHLKVLILKKNNIWVDVALAVK
jgi:hypothetical protein